jgi:adenine-specific DNA methylase
MTDKPCLIEHAFPLEQASLDSVHEKNVRHGHISTLHIWPARRPLAACRAALIATLLPDPGTTEKRRELCKKIGGKVVKKLERKRMPNGAVAEREKKVTEGGILHWGRETENAETLEWFRQEIRKAYGGRAPRVLDPFAGGGAIPLEAMRLGCEATAIDINPVAWFILKCTLEYPQKLAGQKRRLPDFILKDREFMAAFFDAQGLKGASLRRALDEIGHIELNTNRVFEKFEHEGHSLEADLAWHVRAWGRWVLNEARKELAKFYPTYADFQPLKFGRAYEQRPMRLVPADANGVADVDRLNASEFTEEYLVDSHNPRWVAKPTVAYLWARAVRCKACRATLPLLKTRWLCKKDNKRVLLTMDPKPDESGVKFGIDANVPARGGNAAQKREHDKRLGAGTMSRSGAQCPCCGAISTTEDIRLEGKAGRIAQIMTAVVTDGPQTKEYRLPTELEIEQAAKASQHVDAALLEVPFGVPREPIPTGASRKGGGSAFTVKIFGFDQWHQLFTPRQLVALASFVKHSRYARVAAERDGSPDWIEALTGYLYCAVARLADRNSQLCTWQVGADKIGHTFARFALPITWDFVEVMPWANASGGFGQATEWVAEVVTHVAEAGAGRPAPNVYCKSAIHTFAPADVIVTDPPYYDAIPYSDLMDFFYIWLRRTLAGKSPNFEAAFQEPLAPKWDHEKGDGELIDDAGRFGGDAARSKATYEDGMARAFQMCQRALSPDGRLVIVFAHKQPDAWETLVSAIIRAGFIVDGSWPIQTERTARTRSLASAALSSSVWLVCRKRTVEAFQPGWDSKVLAGMRASIRERLRDFWDAGIRGPDFIWAATGPALEAYSQHPIVKKSNDPGKLMSVSEFLSHVRAIVVEYAVGRVLGTSDDAAVATAERLDPITSYYLLHRNDFGFEDAPAGACILYALSCGLSDRDLVATWDLLIPKGGDGEDEEESPEDADSAEESDEGSGAKLRLKSWMQRNRKSLGYEAPGGRAVPLIDGLHRLMHLWKEGDAQKVDDYLDDNALRRSELFHRLVQSLIELSPSGSEERSLLESLSNHIGAKGEKADWRQSRLGLEKPVSQ